jgi:alanine dehydrogenase
MLVGTPKEIKDHEHRIGLIPSTVRELVSKGHRVLVETGAGHGAGISDEDYVAAGAEIVTGADQVFDRADLIVKVKEPLAEERKQLKRGQILFTYLHLATDFRQARDLIATGVSAIAYETVTSPQGTLLLLIPMSEVAGRMAIQVGAHYLEKENGGRGVRIGGVPGVPPADVVILGSGVVGTNAALIALGMGADVIMAGHLNSLRRAAAQLGSRLRTVFSCPEQSKLSATAPTSS